MINWKGVLYLSGKITNYFASGNTARGFYSLYESCLDGLDRLFILKGGPGTGKSSLMKAIGYEWNDKGYDIEFLHCSSDNDSIDGVIIPCLKVGIVDRTAPHVIEPKYPGAIEEYVNLGTAWDSTVLEANRKEIKKLNDNIANTYDEAYSYFAKALVVHDEWEKIYIETMDFTKADQLTTELIGELFAGKSLNKGAKVVHRFLGAATPKGAVDFIPNLTEDIYKRYFIKGRPGSGKSTLLKKVAATAEDKGFDVEIYHCGFDPNSLDMVIIRELGIAIFDSTAPHEYFPDRENDEIVDMYKRTITPGTDEKYATELLDITQRYTSNMKSAIQCLAEVKEYHDELESYYIKAMDYGIVENLKDEIEQEIKRLSMIGQTT
ncbi:PRK06851 family protein [Pseudalkalibacillus salsuginis]|uniref:PRK06851 family protein n=1 Tax=Pseudalkalibacillus salsuginis TaxID=2910972 RepID=UPI001F2B1A97|nr:PRK06851 family protein [Pseudalkalibacillus salsuginis]MCF6410806.1 PRK06851 family protein [Pseudalkalibacillus salsuginis]